MPAVEVAPGSALGQGLFFRWPFPSSAFPSFSVKSRKGSLVGVRADRNLQEPSGLILRARGQRSALWGWNTKAALPHAVCTLSLPKLSPSQQGSSRRCPEAMSEACVLFWGRRRKAGRRTPGCAYVGFLRLGGRRSLGHMLGWVSRIHLCVLSFKMANQVSLGSPASC